MALAARGARNMDDGVQDAEDAEDAAASKAVAGRIQRKSLLTALIVAGAAFGLAWFRAS